MCRGTCCNADIMKIVAGLYPYNVAALIQRPVHDPAVLQAGQVIDHRSDAGQVPAGADAHCRTCYTGILYTTAQPGLL